MKETHVDVLGAPAAGLARAPWKRPLDLLGGLVALLLFSPVMLVLALVVRLDSPGPVLFAQPRLGQGGRLFNVLKFRSMHDGADQAVHRSVVNGWFAGRPLPQGRRYKTLDDPRITRVGRWLRRTSLDELPQLLNVIRGDMSLVGPRPAIPYEIDLYEAWYHRRFLVRPGITGLWQVSGRDRRSAREMMELDVRYADTASLLLDLKILASTPLALFGVAVHL